MPLIVTDDIEAAADALRPMYALYFGGMGAKDANFHANVAIRMGYEAEVDKIQELYLAGHKEEAAAAVPTKLIEQLTLIGPKDKIRHDLEAWRESIVTTLLVGGDPQMLRTAAGSSSARASGGPRWVAWADNQIYASWYSANSHGCGRIRIASTSASRL